MKVGEVKTIYKPIFVLDRQNDYVDFSDIKAVRVPQITPEIKLLVLDGEDVKELDLTSGEVSEVFAFQGGGIDHAVFFDNGYLAIVKDKDVEVRDTRFSRVFRKKNAHDAPISCVDLSKDGTHLATGDTKGFVKIWKISDDSSKIFDLTLSDLGNVWGISSVKFSSSGDVAASSSGVYFGLPMDEEDGMNKVSQYLENWLLSLAFNCDDTLMASIGRVEFEDGTLGAMVGVMDFDGGRYFVGPVLSYRGIVLAERISSACSTCIDFHPTERRICAYGYGTDIGVIEFGPFARNEDAIGIKHNAFKNNADVRGVVFAPDGSVLFYNNEEIHHYQYHKKYLRKEWKYLGWVNGEETWELLNEKIVRNKEE